MLWRQSVPGNWPTWLVATALLFGQPVYADVTDKLVYSYYIASAQPGQPVSAALNKVSPYHQDGRTFHSRTSWELNWHYHWTENSDGKCKIDQVSVELDSKITLPTLVNATVDQQNHFNNYLLSLRTHELGHVGFGRQAAYAIDGAIKALPELASCKALDAAANATATQLLSDYQLKEIQYDATTNHGKTQGASID